MKVREIRDEILIRESPWGQRKRKTKTYLSIDTDFLHEWMAEVAVDALG